MSAPRKFWNDEVIIWPLILLALVLLKIDRFMIDSDLLHSYALVGKAILPLSQ